MKNSVKFLWSGLLCWVGIAFFLAFFGFIVRMFFRFMPYILALAFISIVLKALADYGKQINAKIDQKEDDD